MHTYLQTGAGPTLGLSSTRCVCWEDQHKTLRQLGFTANTHWNILRFQRWCEVVKHVVVPHLSGSFLTSSSQHHLNVSPMRPCLLNKIRRVTVRISFKKHTKPLFFVSKLLYYWKKIRIYPLKLKRTITTWNYKSGDSNDMSSSPPLPSLPPCSFFLLSSEHGCACKLALLWWWWEPRVVELLVRAVVKDPIIHKYVVEN